MAKMGSMDISEFVRLRDNLNKMSEPEVLDKFMRECVAEIAMETLKKTIKLTPVAKTIRVLQVVTDDDGNKVRYKKGKNRGKIKHKSTVIHTGGTLRRGWIAKSQSEAEASKNTNPDSSEIEEFVYKLRVEKIGQTYVVWLVNIVDYASYVEYGHRQEPGRFVPAIGKRLKASWVQGRHMLQISMQEVEARLPQFLDVKLQEYLNQMFGGNG